MRSGGKGRQTARETRTLLSGRSSSESSVTLESSRIEAKRLLFDERSAAPDEDEDEGEDGDGDEEGDEANPPRKKARISAEESTSTNRSRKGGKDTFNARVVVDLGFDELMSENVRPSYIFALLLET